MAKDDQKPAETQADQTTLQQAPENTNDARKQSLEVLKQQESLRPDPSQEEADEIKLRGHKDAEAKEAEAEGSASYQTRTATKK